MSDDNEVICPKCGDTFEKPELTDNFWLDEGEFRNLRCSSCHTYLGSVSLSEKNKISQLQRNMYKLMEKMGLEPDTD